ncbi:MarR family winged helix-turn-helix transcriptional regulator [Gandjariella thermophila]|nr:MarR family transcriptional regulator [Gandjariella thermophila]
MAGDAGDQEAFQFVLALHRLLRTLRREAPAAGLSPTQVIVLAQLVTTGPLRLGELAAQVPCSQPTATTVVRGLEAAGLVRREPDPADRRAIRVMATEEGKEQMVSMAYGQAETLAKRMALLEPRERELLAAVQPVLLRLAAPDDCG